MPSRYEEDRLSERLSAPFQLPIAPRPSPYDKPAPRMPDEADELGRKAYVAAVYGGLVANKPEVQKAITDQYEYNKKRILSGKAPLNIPNVSWRPNGYDDNTNEWINGRYQQTGKLPSAVETWDYIGQAAIQKRKEISFANFQAQAGLKDEQTQPAATQGPTAAGQPDTTAAAAYDPVNIASINNMDDNGKHDAAGNAADTTTGPVAFWQAPAGSRASQSQVLYPNTTLNASPPDDGFNPLDWNDWKKLAGDAGNHMKAGLYGVASGAVGNAVNNLMGADNHVNIVINGDRISVMDTGNAGYDPSDGKVRQKVSTDGGYTFVESPFTEEELAKKLGYGSVKELKLALVNQRSYSDFMNRGNAYSDGIRSNIASQYQDTYDKAAQIGGLGGSSLPVYGDARDALETVQGQDLQTGEALPLWQRGLTGAAMLMPFVGGAVVRKVVDGGGDFLKSAAKHGDEAVDALKQADKAGDAAKGAEEIQDNRPYLDPSNRPSFRKGVVESTWNNAKGPDGLVRDPHTGDIINWTLGQSRKGIWDMGHVPGQQYYDMYRKYLQGEMTPKQFRDWYNNPNNYRPEIPQNNRGHLFE